MYAQTVPEGEKWDVDLIYCPTRYWKIAVWGEYSMLHSCTLVTALGLQECYGLAVHLAKAPVIAFEEEWRKNAQI
jgi:hypothetical protein